MRLRRQRIHAVDRGAIRALTARGGWLVETPNSIRAGFGAPLATQVLDGGLAAEETLKVLDGLDVEGEPAPAMVGPVAFMTVPFERDGPIRAWVPEHQIVVSDDATTWLVSTDPERALDELAAAPTGDVDARYDVATTDYSPTPDAYASAVAQAVELMRHSDLQKVVLARRVAGRSSVDIDPAAVAQRLHDREPSCTLFAFPGGPNERFVGASPELVVANYEGSVSAHPLAGTITLPTDDEGLEYATWLMGSSKNLFEHRVVVEDIVERLCTRCDDVRSDPTPSIVTLRSVAHLGTWIHGKIASPTSTTALELLALVHPTAAVGGIPQSDAVEVIHRLEPQPRGLYAGAVGWMDTEGTGEWWLAIRGITLEGPRFSAWAGAGIVADSDPIAEREETRDKLRSILIGLGADA